MSVKGKQIMEIRKANVLCVILAVVGLPLCAMADGESQEFADGGSLSAALLCREGDRLLHGRGCERDLQGAVECYMEAADMGYVRAEYMLSVCYHNGDGVESDIGLAVAWCEQAASHGHVRAMFNMGIYRHSGMDGVTNAAEACQWFRLAAQHGLGDPDFDSGLDESEGCGQESSFAWIEDMADNGDLNALYWYSRCFLNGWGVPRDEDMAEELMLEAAEMGCLLAKSIVGRDKWYGRLPGGQEEGLELVREAEEQGNVTAYRYLEELDKTGSL